MFANIAIRLMSALLYFPEPSASSRENHLRKIPVSRSMSRLAMERQPYRRGDRLACMKKERIFLSMHSPEALPQAQSEYTEKENAPIRAHLHSHAVLI